MNTISKERIKFLLQQKVKIDNHNINPDILTIKEIKEGIQDICEKYKIKKVYLFGSYAYGMPDDNSDIDLLVDYGECKGMDCIGFMLDVKDKFGKHVDFVSIPYMKDDFKKEINGREILLYENEY